MNLHDSFKALERAEDALENSVYSLHGGFTLGTVNRAYYTMFYCMSALLATKGIHAKTHQDIRAKFGELFIKNSIFPTIIAKYIGNAFDLRQEADYDFEAIITEDEAKVLVENAREFYNLTKEYLEKIA
jgi:uncharacterized protein (UPF0332 family)